MKVNVLNTEGKETGRSVELPDEIFAVEANDHLLWLNVKMHLANKRQGTHESRERAEIAGSTRKIKRQKGTGTARAGSIKSPLFRGGGRIFGPKPRDYSQKLNKKAKVKARKIALSQKAGSGDIVVVEDFTFDAPKTSQFLHVMKNLEVADKNPMLVLGSYDQNLIKSGRNVPKTCVRQATDLSVYDILKAGKVVFVEAAVEQINNQLKSR